MKTIRHPLNTILLFLLVLFAQELSGQDWVYHQVDSGALHTALALDSQDRTHIAYSVALSGGPPTLVVINYAVWDNEGFEFSVVDTGEFNAFVAIAIDRQDYPHIRTTAMKTGRLDTTTGMGMNG